MQPQTAVFGEAEHEKSWHQDRDWVTHSREPIGTIVKSASAFPNHLRQVGERTVANSQDELLITWTFALVQGFVELHAAN